MDAAPGKLRLPSLLARAAIEDGGQHGGRGVRAGEDENGPHGATELHRSGSEDVKVQQQDGSLGAEHVGEIDRIKRYLGLPNWCGERLEVTNSKRSSLTFADSKARVTGTSQRCLPSA